MRILFLTSSERPDNGYAVVGVNICKELLNQSDIVLDIFTASDKTWLPGHNSLKSVYVEKLGWLGILYDFFCLLLMKKSRRYDLIHCNVEHFAAVAMLLSRIWNIPYTVTAHGTYGVVLPKRMGVFKHAFKRAAQLICDSRYTETRIREEEIQANTMVIHLGVDTNVFKVNSGVKKENLITFVGNLKRRKGFPFLLDALKKARDDGVQFQLAVVGNIGRVNPEILEKIQEYKIEVKFTGPIPLNQLVNLYQRAKLNALPSLSEPYYFEGFGLIHVEANACGTLTVGTLDSGNSDAILPGNGYLVKYGDVDGLAEVIRTTMNETDIAKLTPAERGLRDWARVAEEYATLFRSVSGGVAA